MRDDLRYLVCVKFGVSIRNVQAIIEVDLTFVRVCVICMDKD
jgi:hypothetical protein